MDSFNAVINSSLENARSDIKSYSVNTKAMQEISYGLKRYIREAVNVLIDEERIEMRSSSDNTSRILLIFLIIYIISLAIFYFAWAYPQAAQFNTEVAAC